MNLEEILQKYREKGREYGSYDPKTMAENYLTEKVLNSLLPKSNQFSIPNAPNVSTPSSTTTAPSYSTGSTSAPSSLPMLSSGKNLYDFAASSPQTSYSPPPVQVSEAAPSAYQGASSAMGSSAAGSGAAAGAAEAGAGAGAASSGASGAAGGAAAGGAQSGLSAIISKF